MSDSALAQLSESSCRFPIWEFPTANARPLLVEGPGSGSDSDNLVFVLSCPVLGRCRSGRRDWTGRDRAKAGGRASQYNGAFC